MIDTEWEILKSFIRRRLCNNIDVLKDIEEGMKLSNTSNEYDECFVNISYGKYCSTFASRNYIYHIVCYMQNNTNNGGKSSLNVCISSVISELDINNNVDCNEFLVMLLSYLVCVIVQGWKNQRGIHDDYG